MTKRGSLKDKPALSAPKGKIRLGFEPPAGTISGVNPDMDLALFVYGSLQPGGEYWPRFCEGRVVEPAARVCPGSLI